MKTIQTSTRYKAVGRLLPIFSIFLAWTLPLAATTFTVINTNNAGVGSLRQAVLDANVNPGADMILFSLPSGPQTITLTTGQLPLFDHVSIVGPGAQLLEVSGNNSSRVFDIALSRNVAISGMSITNGRMATGANWENDAGAGIRSRGNLTLSNCVLSGHTASYNGSALAVFEANTGTTPHTIIDACTFLNNTGLSSGNGGAVCNGSFYSGYVSTCTMLITNSTFSGNGGIAAGFWGGALANSGTWMKVINCTVTGNTANMGGGMYVFLGTVTVMNSIVAGNTAVNAGTSMADGPDISRTVPGPGTFVSLGHNVIGDNTGTAGGAFTNAVLGDIVGTAPAIVNAMLAAPALNGGETPTCALLCGSPAVDAGDNAVLGVPYSLSTDQRGGGFPRQLHGTVDAGAYESPYPIETVPPTITVSLSPALLWPPNHRMTTIQATVNVSDNCPGTLTYKLISITSNEPDNGLGDGDKVDDIQDEVLNSSDVEFRLRAERSGTVSGRIYTVTYEATDASGNTATVSAEVVVPHSAPKESAADNNASVPGLFTLEQNYPNPFNPSSTIRYTLPADVHTVLKVYDAASREVATLVDRVQRAGTHSVVFNAEQLPSGTYTYRLEAAGKTLLRTMSLMK